MGHTTTKRSYPQTVDCSVANGCLADRGFCLCEEWFKF